MSGFVAILRVAALRAVRSPLLLASGLGAAALWAAFPPLVGLMPHEAVRQGAAYVVYGVVLATGASAVVCALRAPALEPDAPALRLRGPRIATAGELGAIALFVCGLAAACGLGGLTWLRAIGCDPHRATDEAAVRDVVWTNREALTLGPGETFALDLAANEIPADGATFEIAPRVRRVRDAAESRPAGGGGAVVVRRRAKGGTWRREEIRMRRGAPARVVLRGTEEGRPPSDVEVRIDAPTDAVVVVPPGAAAVLGSRAPATSSLLRASMVAAFGALLTAATVRFFRGLVGAPIAIAAATTLALAAAAVGELEAAPPWLRAVASRLPGGGGDDPALSLIAGRCVGWGDVGRAALRAGPASLAAILCARRPPEPRA